MGNVSVQLVTVQWDKRVIKMLYLQKEQHCMNVEMIQRLHAKHV